MDNKSRSWSKLKSFIWEEESQPTPTIPNTSTPTATQTIAVPVQTAGINSEKEKKVIEDLLQLFDDSDLPGPDFREFTIALKEMQKLGTNMDEASIFKAVFSTLKIAGLSKETLVSTGTNQYLKILSDYRKEFDINHQKEVSNKIKSKIIQADEIKKSVDDKMKLIESLQLEINNLKKDFEKFEIEIKKEESNIEETNKAFYSGHGKLTTELTSILEKINKYIQ